MTIQLQDLVAQQAERRPRATAVVGGGYELNYGELEERSNRLAFLLQRGGCRAGDRVCLLVPKSPAAIVGILGVLKAGCIYVPLDPASPPERLARMVRICEPRFLLGSTVTSSQVRALIHRDDCGTPFRLGWLDGGCPIGLQLQTAFGADELVGRFEASVQSRTSADQPAYILFTSGSTGEPKGVVVTHKSVIAFLEWAIPYFGIGEDDRVSSHPPLHFDLSVFDVFGALTTGASLHQVPPELSLLPHKVAEFIRANELTQWFSVPSLLAYMARFGVVRPGDFPSLRRLLWCGEVFPTPPLIDWMKRLPHVRFVNLYGPTEATIASSYHELEAPPAGETAEIPIGRACAGEELLILDAELRTTPPGEVGDLYIRGVGLSPGYWRDAERTRAAFLPDPERAGECIYRTGDRARIDAQGLVHFEGRADQQIKSRGYRIELGEVENSLHRVDGLAECAVFPTATGGFDGTSIACAFVRLPGAAVDPAGIKAKLSEQLPPYMVPTRWLELQALPKGPSGKIDRRELATLLEAGCS